MIYGKKCTYDGYKFDSESERDFYKKLKLLKQKGKIKDFSLQPNYLLQGEFTTEYNERWENYKVPSISYTPDYWVLLNDDNEILIDCKSGNYTMEDSRLRANVFQYNNRELPLFYIGLLPKYLGGVWVNVTKGSDFMGKLKNKYNSLYPNAKKSKNKPVQWYVDDWEKYFEFENVDDMFYIWKSTKRIKK